MKAFKVYVEGLAYYEASLNKNEVKQFSHEFICNVKERDAFLDIVKSPVAGTYIAKRMFSRAKLKQENPLFKRIKTVEALQVEPAEVKNFKTLSYKDLVKKPLLEVVEYASILGEVHNIARYENDVEAKSYLLKKLEGSLKKETQKVKKNVYKSDPSEIQMEEIEEFEDL